MGADDQGRKRRYWLMAAPLIGVGLVVLIGLIWDWNWFRPLVERIISVQLDRTVQLGHFDIKDFLSREPLIVFDAIAVGNPADFPSGTQLGTIDRLSARVDFWRFVRSGGATVILPEIAIERPNGDLRPGPHGNPNWLFGLPVASTTDSVASLPRIGAITITDGNFRVADSKLKADFTIAVQTEAAKAGGESRLVASVRGTYAGQPITAQFSGGALLSLRDPAKPYPVDLTVANGATHIHLHGVVQDPLNFAGADLQLEIEGKSLADLYALIAIPLAPTPPFHLVGHLDYTNDQIRFQKLTGKVGQSDLEGDFNVKRAGLDRPLVTAHLTSRNVVLADLAGFIGGTPGKADAPNNSSELKAQRAAKVADPKVIPDIPIDLPKLQAADFDVSYIGQHLQSESTPFDNVRANLTIENGKVTLSPLSFGIGGSAISGTIHLDPAAGNLVHAAADIEFRQIDLSRILQKITDFKGAGLVGGKAHIKGTGNSLSQMLGSGDGSLDTFMTGGDISALLIDLAGLDLGKSMLSWLGLPDRALLRCMAGNFVLERGLLKTHTLLFDTTEANLIGKGGINLKDETVAFEITTQPKHPSIGRLPLPIDVTGTLKDLTIHPALRIVGASDPATTLLSLLTIQLGLRKDSDCRAGQSAGVPPIAPHLPQPPPRPK